MNPARHHLAQLNIAQMRTAKDDPVMADFNANLDRINALADAAPGFVWRMLGDGSDEPGGRAFAADILANMSLWLDVESLKDYAFRTAHADIMKRRHEWFQRMDAANMVLWWVPAGHIPTLAEARERLELLRAQGPTPQAFTFRQSFPPPASETAAEVASTQQSERA
jgi:Domain of unknown function (DUF3291)